MAASDSNTSASPPHWSHQLGPKTLSGLVFIYCVMFVLPSLAWAADPVSRSIGDGFFKVWMIEFQIWFQLFFLIAQFVPQIFEIGRLGGDPGVLSLKLLALRAVVEVAIGVRWLQRLHHPTWNSTSSWRYIYKWGYESWDFLIEGTGLLLLVVLYLLYKGFRGYHEVGDEDDGDVGRVEIS